MRIVEPPSLDSPGRGRHGDDLDRLLSDFYRSQLPRPWPKPPVAGEQTEPRPHSARKPMQRWSALRSRLALAASIALLLAGSWFLSGTFADVSGSGGSYKNEEAIKGFDQPGGRIRDSDVKPRTRERIILDKNGQTGFQVELDLP